LENLNFETKELSTKLVQNIQSIRENENETKLTSDRIKSPSYSQNCVEILIEKNSNEIASKATREETDDDTTTESDSDEGFTIFLNEFFNHYYKQTQLNFY
jgi:hypothetical protein